MSKDSVVAFRSPEAVEDPLTELLRTGAKRLIQQAIEAELAELLAQYEGRVDEQGRQAVVRNGYLPEREVLTGIGRALRESLDDPHLQQGVRRLGRDLRRPSGGHGYPGPAAAPCHYPQHQGPKLPAARPGTGHFHEALTHIPQPSRQVRKNGCRLSA